MTPIQTDTTGVIFAPEAARKIARQLQEHIENTLASEEMTICDTLNSLVYALLPRRGMRASKQLIVVLFAADMDTLQDLFEFRVLLLNFSVILILPDDGRELAAKAHAIGPCLMMDLATVGKNILRVAEEYKKLRNEL